MSIFTINGSPVKYGNKWLANGGTPSDELPPYDSTNAGQALVVNEDGDGVEWQDVGSSGVVDQHYDPTSSNAQSGTAVAEALQTVPDELPPITGNAGKVLKVNSGETGVEWATESGGATYTAGNGIDITNDEISVDTSVVATQTDLSGKQDTLTAGTNIQINNDVISATDTTYSAGSGLTLTGTEFSADTTVLATQQDLSGKQNALTAGSNITISGDTISATDTTYSAGTGIDITGTTISADTSVLATQNDLSSKQDTLTAGSNITINGTTISATDTTYSAGTGLSLNGTTFSVDDPIPSHTSIDEGKVLKVDSNGDLEWGAESGGTVTDVQVNGTSVVSGGVADITVPAAQVNSDWTASSGVAEILHKPTEKTLAAGSNVTITEANNTVTISATDTTYTAGNNITISSGVISAASQVQADYAQSDSNAVDYIKNKPTIPTSTSDLNNDSGFITSSDVPSAQVQSDWNETNSSSAAYIVNKPTIPTVPTTDQSYNSSSTNPQSGTAVAGALATVTLSTLNTAGITDIQQVASLPANPVATVLYLIPST